MDRQREEDEKEVPTLPEETVLEIIGHSSTRDILAWTSLNKSIYNSIHSPSFISRHLEKSKHKPIILISFYSGVYEKHHFSYLDVERSNNLMEQFSVNLCRRYAGNHVLPPCNGLIFVSGLAGHDLYICNPAIKELISIPRYRSHLQLTSTQVCRYGFGFDSFSKEYKIVNIIHRQGMEGFGVPNKVERCEVLTLGAKSWNVAGDICPYPLSPQQSFHLNGFIHWKVSAKYGMQDRTGGPIVAFDIHLEKFKIISHPKVFTYGNGEWPFLGEVGGKLCLVDCDPLLENVFDIWLLDDYYNETWSFRRTLLPFPLPDLAIPVGSWKEKVLFQMQWSGRNQVVLYDRFSGQFSLLQVGVQCGDFSIHVYAESLVKLVKIRKRCRRRLMKLTGG